MLMQPNTDGNQADWSYSNEPDQSQLGAPEIPDRPIVDTITWTGSEFLDKHKNATWYLSLAVIIAVICAVIYLIGRDIFPVIFIVIISILFAIVASRKPRQIQYSVSDSGLSIGRRTYSFADFKSFSLQQDGAIGYVNLMPLKRLALEVSLYYPPEEENRVIEAISSHIPHDQVEEPLVDRLFKTFHF